MAARRSDMAARVLAVHGVEAGEHDRAAEIQLAALIFCMCVSALRLPFCDGPVKMMSCVHLYGKLIKIR